LTLLVGLVALLVVTRHANAGGPLPEVREETLPHVCKGGGNAGVACSDDTECPGSSCEIDFLKGPGTTLNAVLTLMIDDDASNFGGCVSDCIDRVVTATVLLEVQKDGPKLFTQTYANLFFGATAFDVVQALQLGPPLSDTFGPVSEFGLQSNIAANNVLYNFLLQQPDDPLADALRRLTGVAGRPVIVAAPAKIKQYLSSNETESTVGSALRLKVKIRFVPF
jgi:hypothetical protein